MSEAPSSYEIQTREDGFLLPSRSDAGANNIADIQVAAEPGKPLRVRVIYGEAVYVAEVRERMRRRMLMMGIDV
jgi:hypothetical protein